MGIFATMELEHSDEQKQRNFGQRVHVKVMQRQLMYSTCVMLTFSLPFLADLFIVVRQHPFVVFFFQQRKVTDMFCINLCMGSMLQFRLALDLIK